MEENKVQQHSMVRPGITPKQIDTGYSLRSSRNKVYGSKDNIHSDTEDVVIYKESRNPSPTSRSLEESERHQSKQNVNEKDSPIAKCFEQEAANKKCSLLILVVALIIAVLSFSIWYFEYHQLFCNPSNQTAPAKKMQPRVALQPEVALQKFGQELNSLKDEFPSQVNRTWKTVLTVVKTTLLNKPLRSPGVISIMSAASGTNIANCLGRRIAGLLQDAYNDSTYVKLDGDFFSEEEPSQAKLKIDDIVRNGFKNGDHIVLFENFHAIPPASSMLFHGLCDNENAPFKQAIYIFTVENNQEVNGEDEITAVWTNRLDDDTRASLESRIGNNIITIQTELHGKHSC